MVGVCVGRSEWDGGRDGGAAVEEVVGEGDGDWDRDVVDGREGREDGWNEKDLAGKLEG